MPLRRFARDITIVVVYSSFRSLAAESEALKINSKLHTSNTNV